VRLSAQTLYGFRMRHSGISCIVLFALACASVQEPRAQTPDATINEDLSPVELMGRRLYEKDIAAWLATDAIAATGVSLVASPSSPQGWITVPKGSGWVVRFIGGTPEHPISFYDVEIDVYSSNPAIVETYPQGLPLPDSDQTMWRARQTALNSGFRRCTTNYNTIVLKDPETERWLVYLFAGSQEEVFHIGGHHRIIVSPDGRSILESKEFSKSCLTIPISENSEMIGITQLVSDDPLETTVFLSLHYPTRDFIVRGAKGSVWKAKGGRISKLRNGSPQ